MRSLSVVLVGLALGRALAATAQAELVLDPPRVSGRGGALAPGPLYVARVVDARPTTDDIGRLRPTRPEAARPARFAQPLATTLQAFFNQYAPGQPTARPLVLRVSYFELADAPSVTVSLVGDVYAPRPDSSYRLVMHLAEQLSLEATSQFNPAREHPVNIGALLLQAATRVRDQAQWLPDTGRYTAAYVRAATPHPAELLPVLAPGWRPRPGIYHGIAEFWANQPGEPTRPSVTATPYLTTEWAGDSLLLPYRRPSTGRRELVEDWGYSDGNTFYVRRNEYYYPLIRQGTAFTFRGPVGDDPHYRAATKDQAFDQNTRMGRNAAMASSPALQQRRTFSFSPVSGGSRIEAPALAEPGAYPTQVYVFRRKAPAGPPVRVGVAGGEPPRELAAGDYLSFMLPDARPAQVCLLPAGAAAQCLPVTPLAGTTTYLEYLPGQATPLRQVPAKAGAAALERLAR